MLQSKKFIYNKYRSDVEFVCNKYHVDVSVGIDMIISDLCKVNDLREHIYWYKFPTLQVFMDDYEYYLKLNEEERRGE